jgi:transposase
VDLSRVRVERLRRFGDVCLGLALWRRLGLDQFFGESMAPGREGIAWAQVACVLTLARFCAPSSELAIAERWYATTALDDLLGIGADKINDDRLYRGLDALLPRREELFRHLQRTYGELFGVTFDFLLYDVTSTFFEGTGAKNPQAQRGHSRDGRPDCVQVCLGLVVTPEGLPLAYEVFDGNRTDVTTVEQIVETMEKKYGQARRTWVMDRGMVSEDNLQSLRRRGASYLVGTPKAMLRRFEREMTGREWSRVAPGVEVQLCAAPDGSAETYVLCRSEGRADKERAIRERFTRRLEEGLARLQSSARRGLVRSRAQAERRVGRLLERHARAAKLFDITVSERPDPQRPGQRLVDVTFARNATREAWAALSEGCYLLRTNLPADSPEHLWKTYIGLTQVEDCFRVQKHDLSLRPVFHQRADRVQAHILVCFLALVLWRTLQHWMATSGLGTAPRPLLDAMREVRSLDVIVPAQTGEKIRLRVVSRPEPALATLLDRLGLPLPNRPKRVPNVVTTSTP